MSTDPASPATPSVREGVREDARSIQEPVFQPGADPWDGVDALLFRPTMEPLAVRPPPSPGYIQELPDPVLDLFLAAGPGPSRRLAITGPPAPPARVVTPVESSSTRDESADEASPLCRDGSPGEDPDRPIKLGPHNYLCVTCGSTARNRADANVHSRKCRARCEKRNLRTAAHSIVISDDEAIPVPAAAAPSPTPGPSKASAIPKPKRTPTVKIRRVAARTDTFVPERKPTTPAKVVPPATKRVRRNLSPREKTAVDEATAPARFSHVAFGRIMVTFSHLNDQDLIRELQQRMPRVPAAMLLSHLDTARAVLAQCANRVSLVAGIAKTQSAWSWHALYRTGGAQMSKVYIQYTCTY